MMFNQRVNFIENLRKGLANKRNVIEVRGIGLMVGIEINNDLFKSCEKLNVEG